MSTVYQKGRQISEAKERRNDKPNLKKSWKNVTNSVNALVGKHRVKRTNRATGKVFLGCSNYPTCTVTSKFKIK